MARFCSKCGNEIKVGSKFCNKCGQPVEEPVAQNNNPVPHNRPQTKTANKSNKSNKQMIAISGLLVVVLCSLAFYFFYWTKTPQYSINLIREAVKTHNTEMFEQYVDLDNLIGKGYEDAVDFYLKAQRDKGQIRRASELEIVSAVAKMLKPNIIASAKSEVLKSISEGQVSDSFKNTKALLQRKDIPMRDTSLIDIGLDKKTEIKNISVVSKNSGISIVAIKLHNNKIKNDFDVILKMNQLENGKWKVKEITNTIQVLLALSEYEKL